MAATYAIVLGAGLGTRMKSKRSKVMHPVCGKPMVGHVVDTLTALGVDEIVVVVGHGAEAVRAYLGDRVRYAVQEEQLGTGHAVRCAAPILGEREGTTFVLCGDTPLLRPETLAAMRQEHERKQAAVTLLTTTAVDPTGYGRVVRDGAGDVVRIVEHKDATEEERRIREINTGTYCFDNRKLFSALEEVTNDNAQGEYYLTDCVAILRRRGETVAAHYTPDEEETIGINDRVALARAEAILRRRINEAHMKNGVTIVDPATTYIDAGVMIGRDTVILPGTRLAGETVIGEDAVIGPYTEILDSQIGKGAVIRHSVIVKSAVADGAEIGPFAHLRPGTRIGEGVRVGNFVEVKNSVIGPRSKAAHLTYIGDADVGADVNFGCGSVVVNYDGRTKHRTVVEDGAFIGCNTNLVAPVRVGKGAYTAAGSTITDDVPDHALAIARARQINKPEYVKKWKSEA